MELLYKSVISEELKELEKSLLSSISSDIALATEISNYLLLSGGKRLRPALCIFGLESTGIRWGRLNKVSQFDRIASYSNIDT